MASSGSTRFDEVRIGGDQRAALHRVARALFQAAAPFATGGVYVNFLTALKNRYDPTNLFSVNQNIRPTIVRAAG